MFTLNKDVDIYVEDIIDNLDTFSKSDLKELKEELDYFITDDEEGDKEQTFIIKSVEDEYKVKVLKEMYNKFTLEELDKLNKK